MNRTECSTSELAARVTVIVPTLNGGQIWLRAISALAAQEMEDLSLLVIDSGSMDGTIEAAEEHGVRVLRIPKGEFDHGGTRQWGVEEAAEADIVVFLTHDAVLADVGALGSLLTAFEDTGVGAAFGRQLPRPEAGPIEAHARIFNYPSASRTVSLADIERLGIKAAFISNSFAAYRREALLDVGGFPRKLILGEDTVVAARMLVSGWKVAYRADARVFHSHAYSPGQEFRRYFDTGVLHAGEQWMLDRLGSAEGEGGRFVRSELAYLRSEAPGLIPAALWRVLMKYAGYRLGRAHRRLPLAVKRRFSMHRGYWGQ